jgi:uncharacterized protein YjbJ (UPF0337 family)
VRRLSQCREAYKSYVEALPQHLWRDGLQHGRIDSSKRHETCLREKAGLVEFIFHAWPQQKGISVLQRCHMDNEHAKGATDTMIGKTKQAAGHVTGNRNLETEGMVDQVKGAAHHAAGDAKDAGKEAIDAVKNAPSKH